MGFCVHQRLQLLSPVLPSGSGNGTDDTIFVRIDWNGSIFLRMDRL